MEKVHSVSAVGAEDRFRHIHTHRFIFSFDDLIREEAEILCSLHKVNHQECELALT